MGATKTISTSSVSRVERFVHDFIRSERVANWTAEKDSDFINKPDRAGRCADGTEDGCDGKTHAEVIEDWRECFDSFISDRRWHETPERFCAAVHAHFDSVEAWHERNGSLDQQIG